MREDATPRGTLEAGELHLWRFPLDLPARLRAGAEAVLSADEKERLERLRTAELRRRFLAARSALRRILAGYLDAGAADLRFRYGPAGKPHPAEGEGVWFNLSHSGELGVLAVHGRGRVGVDVETGGRALDPERLARRVLSPAERRRWVSLGAELRRPAFLQAWTRKEAWLKAVGEGVFTGLSRVEVSLGPGEPARLLATGREGEAPEDWTLLHLDLPGLGPETWQPGTPPKAYDPLPPAGSGPVPASLRLPPAGGAALAGGDEAAPAAVGAVAVEGRPRRVRCWLGVP